MTRMSTRPTPPPATLFPKAIKLRVHWPTKKYKYIRPTEFSRQQAKINNLVKHKTLMQFRKQLYK